MSTGRGADGATTSRAGSSARRRAELPRARGSTGGCETADPLIIAELLEALSIHEDRSTVCRCFGQPSIEFRRGGELLATLGVHHGVRLRWAEGSWGGDAELMPDSQERLRRWFARTGVRRALLERR